MYNKGTHITTVDRFLARIFLPLIPSWVTPNHITIFRFVTIPFVVWLLILEYYTAGLMLFAVSAFTDSLDGVLARTTGQVTDWGKLMDPLADKLLIGVSVVVLVPLFFSPYLALAIIVIELVLIMQAYYKKRYLGITVEAMKAGKAKMVFQSFAIGMLFMHLIFPNPLLLTVAWYFFIVAIAFAVVSLVVYRSV